MNDLTMHLVPGAFRRMYLSAFWRVRLAAPRFMLSAAALDNLALRPVAGATPRAAFPFSGNGQDRSGGDAHGAEIPRLVVAIDEDGEARSPEPHGQAAAIRILPLRDGHGPTLLVQPLDVIFRQPARVAEIRRGRPQAGECEGMRLNLAVASLPVEPADRIKIGRASWRERGCQYV